MTSHAARFFSAGPSVPTAGGTGYQPGNDTKVKEAFLWGLPAQWSTMDVQVNAGVLNTKRIKICTHKSVTQDTRFTSNNPNLRVEICFAVTGSKHRFPGARVDQDPNSAEWTLNITGWSWGTNPSSRLALKTSFDAAAATTSEATFRPNSAESARFTAISQTALNMGSNEDGAALLSWDNSADISGGSCASQSTAIHRGVIWQGEATGDRGDLTNDNAADDVGGYSRARAFARVVYYSFLTDCHPNTIVWGPSLGIETEELSAAAAVGPSIFVLGTLLAALVSFLK